MSIATPQPRRAFQQGFTLMETVIAIGILAILLTAFLGIFGPAMKGIRSSMNVEEANRLTTALESELSTLGKSEQNPTATVDDHTAGKYLTAFNKAYFWIRDSSGNNHNQVLFAYTYKGDPQRTRDDGSMEPYTAKGGNAGEDFVLQAAVRRRDDPEFLNDLAAIDSRVFMIKVKQLTFQGTGQNIELKPTTNEGQICDPATNTPITNQNDPATYPDAVIAYAASFYELPTTSAPFLQPGGALDNTIDDYDGNRIKPIFTRNLGVRR